MISINKRLYWKGFCNGDRHSSIHRIEGTVGRFGYITDFRMFSDLEISLFIEVDENRLEHLYKELEKQIDLNEAYSMDSESSKTCFILLNITFLKSTGKLEQVIPSVPG